MHKVLLIIILTINAAVSIPVMAQSDFTDILSGVLDAMSSTNQRKSGNGRVSEADILSDVADEMTVGSTLDYLYDLYNTPVTDGEKNRRNRLAYTYPSGYYNSGVRSRAYRSYAYLIPPGAVAPVRGHITSRFGYRPQFGRMHHGTDIAVNVGDTIRAAIEGTVSRISNDPHGYGLFICLQHAGGLETRYAHLSGCLVTQGMRVSTGQPIALGGNSGNSTGPHLHFETRVNGDAVDLSAMFNFSSPAEKENSFASRDLTAQNGRQTLTPTSRTADGTPKSTYVVRIGDTIQSIARQNGISVLKLCNLNMLAVTDILQPGRMLKLR